MFERRDPQETLSRKLQQQIPRVQRENNWDRELQQEISKVKVKKQLREMENWQQEINSQSAGGETIETDGDLAATDWFQSASEEKIERGGEWE